MKLIIHGIPKPKQSARFRPIRTKAGKIFIHSYQTKDVIENENNIRYSIIKQLPKDFKPFENGVIIKRLLYVFPPTKNLRKSDLQKIEQYENGDTIFKTEPLYKTTKPDLTDNLQKGLFDALEGIVFNNDSQICRMENVLKIYGTRPRIEIEIQEV